MNSTRYKILSGFGFDEKGPYLTIDKTEGQFFFRENLYVIGSNFTINRQLTKYCIGRYDLGTFESFPCPNKSLLTGKKESICFDCFKFNGFNPSFYNMPPGQISLKQRQYNLAKHNVYLAIFAGYRIKVGISHFKRTQTRWLEQGARVATIIYECENAYLAREIEETISKNLKLSETFSTDQKRRFLKDSIRNEKITELLDTTIKNIDKLFYDKQIKKNNYVVLDEHYLKNNQISQGVIDLTNEQPICISGKGIGLVGDALIFENINQQFMISLKSIMGQEITLAEEIVKQNFIPTQISLF